MTRWSASTTSPSPASRSTPTRGTLSIARRQHRRGRCRHRRHDFTVNRAGGDAGAVSATWTINLRQRRRRRPRPRPAADRHGQLRRRPDQRDDHRQRRRRHRVRAQRDLHRHPLRADRRRRARRRGRDRHDPQRRSRPRPGDVFINEIHYDDAGTDAGEAIEIAGPAGTSLAGWTLVLYNGNGGAHLRHHRPLGHHSRTRTTATAPCPSPARGGGIQNGAAGRHRLGRRRGNVVQFLSYEGTFIATNGPAAGMTSTDIGVAEEPARRPTASRCSWSARARPMTDFHWAAARRRRFRRASTPARTSSAPTRPAWSRSATSASSRAMPAPSRWCSPSAAPAASPRPPASTGSSPSPAAPTPPISARPAALRPRRFRRRRVGRPDHRRGRRRHGRRGQRDLRRPARQPGRQHRHHRRHRRSAPSSTTIRSPLAIYEIQGEGHLSAYDGQPVHHHRHRHRGRVQRLLPPGPDRRRQCPHLGRHLRVHRQRARAWRSATRSR